MAIVELVGTAIPIPGFAQHEDIVAAAEGIREDGAGAEVDVGVLARGLTGR